MLIAVLSSRILAFNRGWVVAYGKFLWGASWYGLPPFSSLRSRSWFCFLSVRYRLRSFFFDRYPWLKRLEAMLRVRDTVLADSVPACPRVNAGYFVPPPAEAFWCSWCSMLLSTLVTVREPIPGHHDVYFVVIPEGACRVEYRQNPPYPPIKASHPPTRPT